VLTSLAATTPPVGAQPVPEWIPLMVMVVGVIMLGMLFTLSIRSKIARRKTQLPQRSPREIVRDAQQEREQLNRIEAASSRLLESAQRLAAQLDNKARRLEVLLEEADDRIRSMEMLDARPLRGGADPARPSLDEPVAGLVNDTGSPESAGRAEPARGSPAPSATPTSPVAITAADPGSVPSEDRPAHLVRAVPAAAPVALDPLTRSVYELADGGLAAVDIARRLDEQVGKVELILALRRGGAA
jgi:hypothetical protein